MRVAIFGKSGQVARAMAAQIDTPLIWGRDSIDLVRTPQEAETAILGARPDAVINAAAWTAVDAAEDNRDAAFTINGTAPGAMAGACAELGIPIVHISTDYVFDGSGDAPWHPQDPTAPLGVYGASKLAGEEAVRAAGGVHAILRTSWVFSAHGSNFVKTMLRLSETRDHLTIVADQVGGPTPASAIAAACVEITDQLITDPGKSGTYHLSGAPDVSWADFAREIFRQAGKTIAIEDIPSSAYPTPAPRPQNSQMNCTTTQTTFGIDRPDWSAALASVLYDLANSKP